MVTYVGNVMFRIPSYAIAFRFLFLDIFFSKKNEKSAIVIV